MITPAEAPTQADITQLLAGGWGSDLDGFRWMFTIQSEKLLAHGRLGSAICRDQGSPNSC